ncbi:MAG: ATP-binding protein [Candidatus Scalindua sp.]
MKNFIARSLRTKLTALFLVISIVPMCIVGYISYDNARASLEKQSFASLEAIVNSCVSDITHLIQLRLEQAKVLAGTFLPRQLESSGVNDPEVIAKIQTHIESILEEMKMQPKSGYGDIDKATAIEIIGIWDTKGTIVANTNKELVGKTMPDHYLQGVKSKGTFFAGFQRDPLTGEEFLIFLRAIRDYEDAKFAGVVLFKVKAQILNDITGSQKGMGKTGEILLGQKVGDKVEFIVQLRHTNDPPTVILGSDLALPVQEAVQGRDGKGISVDYRNEEILAVWKHIPSMEWGIVGKIDTKEAFDSVTTLRIKIFFVLIIIGILVVIVAVAISRGITYPIRRLVDATSTVGKGDLTTEVKIKSRDELGKLAAAFNQMTADLRETTISRDGLNQEVLERKKSEKELGKLKDELETKVSERTKELGKKVLKLDKSRRAMLYMVEDLNKTSKEVKQRTTELEVANKELEASQLQLLSKERLATLGQLTSVVSHELRNPLGTILSSLFIIKERLLGKDPKLDKPLERAERSVKRCNNIIEEMLYYTRERDPDSRVIEFDKWLDELLDEHEIPDGIRLTRKLSAGIEISFDPEQLHRCVINVINNACEAMMEESEPQTEECEGVEDNQLIVETGIVDDRLNVRIIDTGPGMSQEKLEKVFEPLYSTKSFGAGLGLSIVKQIIERHKGGIEIKSKLMKGTAITLWLPVRNEG